MSDLTDVEEDIYVEGLDLNDSHNVKSEKYCKCGNILNDDETEFCMECKNEN
jgi:hypothetical protein